jgi:hypothetical protein
LLGLRKTTQDGNKKSHLNKKIIKTCFATMAMDSFGGVKPAQNEKQKNI